MWVSKCEAGAFDDEAKAAELLQEQEARIVAFERLVGRSLQSRAALRGTAISGAVEDTAKRASEIDLAERLAQQTNTRI